MEIRLGQVVYSKAGRDADRVFVIIDIIDDKYVLISDGDLRKIEKPKRKKIKHLGITEEVLKSLNEKLENKQKVTNAELRKLIAACGDEQQVDDERSC